MAVRKKRSISLPPDLDDQIAAAAEQAGVTYSAWLAATARKEFTDGIDGDAGDLTDAVSEPAEERGLFGDELDRFGALGGAELEIPARSVRPRAADVG
jgi:hypothetical protein